MSKHPFLSAKWIEDARRIHEELALSAPPEMMAAKVNLVVTDLPFAEGALAAHLETGPGLFEIGPDHLSGADATVTLEHSTAYAVFIEGDPQIGMQAFMAGRIRVDGDVAKLIPVFGGMGAPNPLSSEIGRRLRDITEPPAA